MDTYTLFDPTDLSLFGGDLEAVNEFAIKDHGNATTLVADISPLNLDLQLNESDVSSQLLSPSLPSQGVLELPDWLDSKVDLLDLLGLPVGEEKVLLAEDDSVAATPEVMLEEPGTPVDNVPQPEAQGATGLDLLQSMAEEMVSMITSEPEEVPQPVKEEGADLDIMELLSGGSGYIHMDVVPSLDATPLSPVTPEDVDNVLSSGCSSPSSVHGDSSFTDDSIAPVYSAGDIDMGLLSAFGDSFTDVPSKEIKIESKSSKSSRRSAAPYDRKRRDVERKLKKKQQNKDAATRYRQKKRAESDAVNGELDQLESRNKQLHDTVDQMTREIKYLKDLLNEVYKAKGLLK